MTHHKTPTQIFAEYFETEPDHEAYFQSCTAYLVGVGMDKGLRFDAYAEARKQTCGESAYSFAENFFDEPERKRLYVQLGAIHNEEMYALLAEAYRTARLQPPSKEELNNDVVNLVRSGVKL